MFVSLLDSPRRRTLLGVLLLLLPAFGWFGSVLLGLQSVYWGDQGFYAIPLLAFQQKWLDAGILPLWNPHYFCGTPFLGNPQVWPFHPSSLLLYLFSAAHVSGLIGVLHLVFAAVGTLLFLRRRGLSLAPSLLGAVAFGYGGALVSKMQFPNMVQTAAYLPWLLWGVEGALRRPSAGRAALLGLLGGLSLLAAHPQMFLVQVYVCLFWTLFRLPRVERKGSAVAALGAATLLCLLLSAVQVLPAVEMMQVSTRESISLKQADRWVLPLKAALTVFVAPNHYGNPLTGNYRLLGNFWEPCAYLGLLPFLLALFQAATGWRRAVDTRFWTVAAALAVWLALGKVAGLYPLAYRWMPGVGVFHDPARWLQVAGFGLAALAGFGLQFVQDRIRGPMPYRLAVAGAVIVITVFDLLSFSRGLIPTVDGAVWNYRPPVVRRLDTLPRGRILHLDRPYAWRRYFAHRTYGPRTPLRARQFLEAFGPNLPMYYGIDNALGYDPVRRRDMDRFLGALWDQMMQAERTGASAPLLQTAGVAYVVSVRYAAPPGASLGLPYATSARRGVVTRVQPVQPPGSRAVLWRTWIPVSAPEVALARAVLPRTSAAPVVVTPVTSDYPTDFPGMDTPLAFADEEPDRIVLRLPDGHGGGLVTLADTLHAGWRATVDGRPAPLLNVNGVFRGVFAPASAKTVAFAYFPQAFFCGLFVSLAGVAVLAAVAAFRLTRTGPTR